MISILALLEHVIKNGRVLSSISYFDFLRGEIQIKYSLVGSYLYLTLSKHYLIKGLFSNKMKFRDQITNLFILIDSLPGGKTGNGTKDIKILI